MSAPAVPPSRHLPPTPSPKSPPGSPRAPVFALTALVCAICAALLPSEDRKLKPYKDSASIWTVCMGIIGKEVWRHPGIDFTVPECEVLEKAYVTRMVNDMGRCIDDKVEGQMKFDQWMALGHWNYNTGAFCNSGVQRQLNLGNHHQSCTAMGQWTWITIPKSQPPRGKHKIYRDNITGKHIKTMVDCRDPANKCGGLPKRRDYEVKTCLESLTS